MSLIRLLHNPFFSSDFFDLDRQITRMFDGYTHCASQIWHPKVNIKENDSTKELVIQIELPGMSKDDVDVHLENGVLTISGERNSEKKEENERWRHIERHYGKFSRSFNVGDGINPENIRANFNNGVLELVLPKVEQHNQRMKISIA